MNVSAAFIIRPIAASMGDRWAPIMLAKLATLPQLQDVTGDLQATAPRLMLKIDRDAIGRFGITPQTIDALYDAFGQRQVATIFSQLNQRRVILEVTPSYQEDASSLEKLYVRERFLAASLRERRG
jgi:multidrug efflux pump